ncbi:alpha/beta hydrolase [Thermopolyspora sp. NPDC052614]
MGPHDKVEVWQGAGHFLHQEQPDRFNDLALTWIKTLPQETSEGADHG